MHVDATGGLSAVDNPAGWFSAVERPGSVLIFFALCCFVGRQVLSWRCSSGNGASS